MALTAKERGARIAAGKERRRQEAIERCELVPNAPLRERYLRMVAREEVQLADLAELMGLGQKGTTDLLRLLGIEARTGRQPTTVMAYDTAVRLLGMDTLWTPACDGRMFQGTVRRSPTQSAST